MTDSEEKEEEKEREVSPYRWSDEDCLNAATADEDEKEESTGLDSDDSDYINYREERRLQKEKELPVKERDLLEKNKKKKKGENDENSEEDLKPDINEDKKFKEYIKEANAELDEGAREEKARAL